MPAPPNTTPETAVALSPPQNITLDVSEATGPDFDVWYRYTAILSDTVIGLWAFADLASDYQPRLNVFTGTPSSLTGYLGFEGLGVPVNVPIYFPVTNGTTYYIRVRQSNSGVTPNADLELSAQHAPSLPAPTGSIFINDDGNASGNAAAMPAAFLSASNGTLLRYLPFFINGERGEMLPSGVSLWEDKSTTQVLRLYSPSFTLTASPEFFHGASVEVPISSNRDDTFYVCYPATREVTTIAADGTLGPTTWTVTGTNPWGIAPSPDETILYYHLNTSAGAVKRWNLQSDTGLSDLAASVADYDVIRDLLVLSDGSILVGYYKESATRDSKVIRYAANGSTLSTYELGEIQLNRIQHALDSPVSFWVWMFRWDTNDTISRFQNIRISDGAVLASFDAQAFSGGKYLGEPTPTPTARFGHSESCPFIILAAGASPEPTPVAYTTVTRIPRRLRRAPHLTQEQLTAVYNKLQIEFESGLGVATGQGQTPEVMLRWSDDGGHTWSNEKRLGIGPMGQYRYRTLLRRLGRSRERVFEVTISDPVLSSIIAAYLDVEMGSEV